MKLEGKRIAVLAENMYQELELWYPVLRMREEGATVVIVGTGSASTYTSKLGYPVTVDVAAGDVSPQRIVRPKERINEYIHPVWGIIVRLVDFFGNNLALLFDFAGIQPGVEQHICQYVHG